ncbi:CinA family protein [Pseudomonas sp. LRF_L74]|uniref:CinA family protein n=1 Tax=Pseudomonas sp. LRF_L74 TaxID=3369422 RepID=UPI003F61AEEF
MQSVEQVVSFLEKYQLSLTTAESCTAGLMASMIADVPGGGSVLESGFVVYSASAKNTLLGVSFETMRKHGLSSEEVAREMAVGALKLSQAKIVLANTGLADSEDDARDGLMCFACSMSVNGHEGVVSETIEFEGRRNEVRAAAARYALLRLPYYYERLRIV